MTYFLQEPIRMKKDEYKKQVFELIDDKKLIKRLKITQNKI